MGAGDHCIDPRSGFNGGYLYVKTDKPYYYQGSEVQGKIYIRLNVPMNASHLEIRIGGKEKTCFTTSGDHPHKEKTEHRIMQFKGTALTFGGPLQPGDYVIPFSFQLPDHMPASIMYKNCHDHNKPKVMIKYKVKAVLHTHDHHQMKYEQLLVIHEPPVPFVADSAHTHTAHLTTWCCQDQGKGTISA